jgi:hypothetical protein
MNVNVETIKASVEGSDKIALSENKESVKRHEPLPEFQVTKKVKTEAE